MSGPLIYLVAGEPSGDFLGARLMAALRSLSGGDIAFAGVGGEAMRAEGMASLFPQADLAVMGLAEVLPRIPRILRRLEQTLGDIAARRPDAIVTIDSWGFTGRLAKRLKASGSRVPRIHYVAPMVWAWREKRVHQLAARVDLLLCLLPNEPPYFERVGLRAIHVGHPVIESGADRGDAARLRANLAIPWDAPVLCLLPGSRRSETSRLLPIFGAVTARLPATIPGLRVVIPTVETVGDEVARTVASWPLRPDVVRGAEARYDAFAASRAALAASGTVTLELAMAGLPMVVGYRVAPLTGMIARRLLKIGQVSLPNLLAGRPIVPEFLQQDCRPAAIVPELERLMTSEVAREEQRTGLGDALARLQAGVELPSHRAARAVLEAIAERGVREGAG